MAEYSATPTSSWAVLVAGPIDLNIQNQGSCEVRYAVHTTTPVGSGLSLKPGQIHPVKATTGSNVYVRARDATTDASIVAIDVPSA